MLNNLSCCTHSNQIPPKDHCRSKIGLDQDDTIRTIQRRSKVKLKTSTPLISQFGLFMDSGGVVRCQGRLGNSTLNLGSKNPILLSPKHHFVKLLMWDKYLN